MNTKARTQSRREFVMTVLPEIKELIERYPSDRLWSKPKPKPDHPIRVWIESIREKAGYSPHLEWRTIWFTLRRDYEAIKRGWSPIQ